MSMAFEIVFPSASDAVNTKRVVKPYVRVIVCDQDVFWSIGSIIVVPFSLIVQPDSLVPVRVCVAAGDGFLYVFILNAGGVVSRVTAAVTGIESLPAESLAVMLRVFVPSDNGYV